MDWASLLSDFAKVLLGAIVTLGATFLANRQSATMARTIHLAERRFEIQREAYNAVQQGWLDAQALQWLRPPVTPQAIHESARKVLAPLFEARITYGLSPDTNSAIMDNFFGMMEALNRGEGGGEEYRRLMDSIIASGTEVREAWVATLHGRNG